MIPLLFTLISSALTGLIIANLYDARLRELAQQADDLRDIVRDYERRFGAIPLELPHLSDWPQYVEEREGR